MTLGCAGTSAFGSADPEYRMLVAVKCDRLTIFINVLPGIHHPSCSQTRFLNHGIAGVSGDRWRHP